MLFMLAESGLTPKLAQFSQPNGQPYIIYGVTQNIIAPYCGAQITSQQLDFNKSMSKVRVSLEWTLGKLLSISILNGTAKFYYSLLVNITQLLHY